MTTLLPAGSPQTLGAAFAHINSVTAPTLDDLKVMVLVEAAGLELYRGVASGTDNPAVIALLDHNGREELAHAHRVSKAIAAINGEEFLPPAAEDNPYLAGEMPQISTTAEAFRGLAQGEFSGQALYESWAQNSENPEAARLFRLNGKEEADHGNRLLEAAALLEA
jgi:rubrerythrin